MKDNNDKILRSSLSTLLKRFSNTDLISTLDKQYNSTSPGYIHIADIDDNHVLKKARINDQRLSEIMNHISEKGVDTPLFIMAIENNRFEVLYPRIVYMAAKKLKWDCLPCIVIDINEEDMLVFLATRLRDTKGSNIIELSFLLNRLAKKYKYNQKEIASIMNQSRSQITNIMRLIKMPDWILRDIADEKLSFGHARAISTLSEEDASYFVKMIYEEKLSVRELEHRVNVFKNKQKNNNKDLPYKLLVGKKEIVLTFASDEEKEEFLKKFNK